MIASQSRGCAAVTPRTKAMKSTHRTTRSFRCFPFTDCISMRTKAPMKHGVCRASTSQGRRHLRHAVGRRSAGHGERSGSALKTSGCVSQDDEHLGASKVPPLLASLCPRHCLTGRRSQRRHIERVSLQKRAVSQQAWRYIPPPLAPMALLVQHQ